MKKIALLLLVSLLCLSLCSCETILKKARSAVTGEEESQMPKDYVTTLENAEYTYDLYKEYVIITKYLGEATEVVIPSKIDDLPVKVIGSLCFHDTEAKVTSVTIPPSVNEIEEQAFYLAENLTSIVIPDTVKTVGVRAFAWCNALESITIGSGISEIPDYCFNNCESLVSVIIPSNVKKIGLRAFSYCGKLQEQTIPVSIESVGDMAFTGCPTLEYVIFENTSVSLGKDIFTNTSNVIVISSEDSTAKTYCAENNLRWSTSKDIEAVILGGDESGNSDVTSDISE